MTYWERVKELLRASSSDLVLVVIHVGIPAIAGILAWDWKTGLWTAGSSMFIYLLRILHLAEQFEVQVDEDGDLTLQF